MFFSQAHTERDVALLLSSESPLFRPVLAMILPQLEVLVCVMLPSYLMGRRRPWTKPPMAMKNSQVKTKGAGLPSGLELDSFSWQMSGEAVCEYGDGDEGLLNLSPSCHHFGRTSSQKSIHIHQ